jgi:hypothetical protein
LGPGQPRRDGKTSSTGYKMQKSTAAIIHNASYLSG